MPTTSASPWWRPENHLDRRPFLLARNRIKQAVRGWFEAEDFVEVEAAALQVSPGNEAHLHAFATDYVTTDGVRSPLYLHTSPEFACKKLLAAGERRIFDFARVWRNRERGPLHHPEFTLLEWYRAEVAYETLMDDCATLLALAAETIGAGSLTFRGHTADPFATPERVTVAQAFERFAGIDLLATVDLDGSTDREGLAAASTAAGVRVAEDDTWADVFSRVMVERVEPELGQGRATILCEYPTPEAALARPKPDDPRVAERFELYACGVELANAFGELTDAAEQRRRFEAEMAEKARVYGERYPLDEDFLAALDHMPQASGAALGFDRLVMLATGAARIEQVLWVPVGANALSRDIAQAEELRHTRRSMTAAPTFRISKTLRTPRALARAGLIPADRTPALERVAAQYAVAITPAMAELIDADDDADPIARQFIPQEAELDASAIESGDPIGDFAHSPVEGIVHRYPDRVLLKPTHTCAVYCRFCFRREMVGPEGLKSLSPVALDAALAYIAERPQIWEVIVTGGDPLVLSPRRLRDLMARLEAIEHVKVVRFHTRVPAVDPGAITDELAAALKSPTKAVYVALHANHPRELTPAARAACARLVDTGIPMLSQTVLLRGVNDDPETLGALMRAFVETRIKPYYLHQGDLAPGTSHLRTTIDEGQAVMRALRGRFSGLCQPTYVLDIPDGHGKVPIGPTYLAETAQALSIEDPSGASHLYPPEREGSKSNI